MFVSQIIPPHLLYCFQFRKRLNLRSVSQKIRDVFLQILEGNGKVYVPVQPKVNHGMIFIKSKPQFTGISVYRCSPTVNYIQMIYIFLS